MALPKVDLHEIELWLWFFVGTGLYWLKRAYYLVTGPNPVANTYTQFIQRCWIPLLVRAFIDSLFFWALFTPGFADKALNYLGWTNWSWAVTMITQFGVFAAAFGHTVDSVVDFAVSKIPFINTVVPQMPPPLPANMVLVPAPPKA